MLQKRIPPRSLRKSGDRSFLFRLWLAWSGQSLTVKLFVAVSIVIFLIVSAGSLAVVSLNRHAIAETSVSKALYHIQLLKTKLLETMLSDDPRHETLRDMLLDKSSASTLAGSSTEINIFNKFGKVTFSSESKKIGQPVAIPKGKKVRVASDDAIIEMGHLGRRDRLRMIHPITGSSKCAVCHNNQSGESLGGIELLFPLEPVYKEFSKNRLYFTLAALTIVLFGAFLIRWLVHTMVKRPIKKLIHVMEKAEKGELDVRTRIDEDPELRRLAHSFNAMVYGILRVQKKVEEQHQRELSQSNRLASLGELISNVSHEIKNPLAALSSALHTLRQEYEPRSGEKQIFEELTKQIERIEKTVNQLLRYARQAPPRFEKLDVCEPLQTALALAESHLKKLRIQVKTEGMGKPGWIRGDAGLLQQIFLNLILNATQAMKPGGELVIRKILEAENLLRIEVRDNGSGISKEHQSKIFQPFFTTRMDGTGLGLSVVKGMVENLRGKIEIQSEPGQGTCVILHFPALQDR